jgi:Leucine-rich repeat (LRR) protein
LGHLERLTDLKSLHCEGNELPAGALAPVAKLTKLQSLFAGGNRLGKTVATGGSAQPQPLPTLPAALKQIVLDHNCFSTVPRSVVASTLIKLEKLDLSFNQLAAIPEEISNLKKLEELKLDHNMIVSLPASIGKLSKLKVLSLKENAMQVTSTTFSERNPQPLPASLFADTPLIDLNLHGNKMTSTQLNAFEGFKAFLDRRQKVKTTGLYGGAMTNLDVCGLE